MAEEVIRSPLRDEDESSAFFSAETSPNLPAQREVEVVSSYRPRELKRVTRMGLTPFLALLPRFSEARELRAYRSTIVARLKALHSHVNEGGTEESLKSLASEEAMLNQAQQWLGSEDEALVSESSSLNYDDDELFALYELGRLYLEMGYFGPSERIFAGLVALGVSATPGRLALGVLRLEKGLFDEAVNQFRVSVREGSFVVEAKLGLSAGFLARGETQRAASLLGELKREVAASDCPELQTLWKVLVRRCTSAEQAL